MKQIFYYKFYINFITEQSNLIQLFHQASKQGNKMFGVFRWRYFLRLTCLISLVASGLGSLTTTTPYQNPYILMVDMSFNGIEMMLLVKDIVTPTTTYITYINMATHAQSPSYYIFNYLTTVTQIYGTNPQGVYYYMLIGDTGGTDHRIVIYEKFTLGQLYDWLEPHYNGLYIVFGETHNVLYSLTQFAGNFQVKKIDLPTRLPITSVNSSVGIAKSINYQSDTQRVVVVALSTQVGYQLAKVLIYDTNLALLSSFTHQYLLSQTVITAVSNQSIVIATGNKITSYDILAGGYLWNTTLTGTVIEMKIKNHWVFALTAGILWQIGPGGFVMMSGNISLTSQKLNIIATPTGISAMTWSIGGTSFQTYVADDVYPCNGAAGCQCAPGYCFTSPSFIACNRTGLPCIYFPPIPTNLTSDGVCLIKDQNGICTTFCDMGCGTCLNTPSFCLSCRNQFYQLQDNCECKANDRLKIIANLLSFLNTLRISNLQPMYLFFDRIQLHNYHSTNYTGTVQSVFQFVDSIKQQFWTFLDLKPLRNWMDEPINIPSYVSFTPLKFQQVERKDSLFIQNTKDYFLIYLPLTSLIFFLLNRFFHLTREQYVSSYFRIYSFWPQLWFILVLQNISMMWFLCFNELMIIFEYNFQMWSIRTVTIPIIGFIFIFSVSFFYVTQYMYGRLSKYFVINMKKSKYTSTLMLLRYVLKPIIESTLTAMIRRNSILLISLMISQFCTVIIIIGFELSLNIFKSKCLFTVDVIVEFLMICLNLQLLLKYEIYPELQFLADSILITLYLLAFEFVFLFFYSALSIISSCKLEHFRCKKKKTIHFVNPTKKNRSTLQIEVINEKSYPQSLNQCLRLEKYMSNKKEMRQKLRHKIRNDEKKTKNHLIIKH